MSDALVSVEDLHVHFTVGRGRDASVVRAVDGVSFELRRGETLGLVGESGCGKSTLAASVLRLLPPSTELTGKILLHGEDVLGMKFGRLRAVRWTQASIIFQGAMHALNPVHRIGDQIAEPILLHEKISEKSADKRVAELLD